MITNLKTPAYLTQKKLETILSEQFSIKTEVKIDDTKFKSDIQFEHDGQKYAVEFDGDSHYCDLNVMQRDLKKDKILMMTLGVNVVRIPYWIQLDDYTFQMFFRFKSLKHIHNEYPHGFIDKKAKLPAQFCVNGIQKFLNMMDYMAEKFRPVFYDIMKSLVVNSKNENLNDIIPLHYGFPELKNLLEYLIYQDSFTSKHEKRVYLKFLNMPKIQHPKCSIENTMMC